MDSYSILCQIPNCRIVPLAQPSSKLQAKICKKMHDMLIRKQIWTALKNIASTSSVKKPNCRIVPLALPSSKLVQWPTESYLLTEDGIKKRWRAREFTWNFTNHRRYHSPCHFTILWDKLSNSCSSFLFLFPVSFYSLISPVYQLTPPANMQ